VLGREVDALVWLEQMREGSRSAFGQFYETYADLVYRAALQKTGDANEAEDVCHDVFLEVLDKPWQYDPRRGSVEAWLVVKAKSRSLDRVRRRKRLSIKRWEEEVMTGAEKGAAVDDTVVSRLEMDSLRKVIEGLPPHQMKALLGAYMEERTHRELAEALDCPMGTIKSWIRSGLKHLRQNVAHPWNP
jgi:RNA polymerase sigma factor (sigma-70 family)